MFSLKRLETKLAHYSCVILNYRYTPSENYEFLLSSMITNPAAFKNNVALKLIVTRPYLALAMFLDQTIGKFLLSEYVQFNRVYYAKLMNFLTGHVLNLETRQRLHSILEFIYIIVGWAYIYDQYLSYRTHKLVVLKNESLDLGGHWASNLANRRDMNVQYNVLALQQLYIRHYYFYNCNHNLNYSLTLLLQNYLPDLRPENNSFFLLPQDESTTVQLAPKVALNSVNPTFSLESYELHQYKHILKNPFKHPFHLVDPSPWPLCTSLGLWYLTLTTVCFFHNFVASAFNILFGILYLAACLAFWWRDVIRESTYEFQHTPYVRRGLLVGMMLFIISEIMFFFGFFWAFFHVSLVPSHNIGGIWPPIFIDTINPWQLPLVNTLCLLLSGVTLTIAHRQLNGIAFYNQLEVVLMTKVARLLLWMQVTIGLGSFFLMCQALEYYLSPFTFQDTVFGGTFYILTGLHGMHVIVGTIFLIVCYWRASRLHFTAWKQVGFKSAVWYWHFVDVVWIFLFIVIYLWGGN